MGGLWCALICSCMLLLELLSFPRGSCCPKPQRLCFHYSVRWNHHTQPSLTSHSLVDPTDPLKYRLSLGPVALVVLLCVRLARRPAPAPFLLHGTRRAWASRLRWIAVPDEHGHARGGQRGSHPKPTLLQHPWLPERVSLCYRVLLSPACVCSHAPRHARKPELALVANVAPHTRR